MEQANWLIIVVGAVLLAFGRRFFWLFVGVVGFLAGFTLAQQYLGGQEQWVQVLLAVVVGLLAAGLAGLVQRLAIGLAGFVAGGLLLNSLLIQLGVFAGDFNWIAFLIGGILGAALLAALFDWALILLSSLVGAELVVRGIGLEAPLTIVAIVGLVILGVLVQSSIRRGEH